MLSARISYILQEQNYLLSAEQEMLTYGRSEQCLPNLEQDTLIGDNSEHIFLLSAEQY